jgi:hypothetical protein
MSERGEIPYHRLGSWRVFAASNSVCKPKIEMTIVVFLLIHNTV